MLKKFTCTMQHDASDCAAAAIATILERYKVEMSIMKLREILGTDIYGTSVKGIVEGLDKLQFESKAVRTDIDSLTHDVTMPAIAQVTTKEGMSHFVVIHKISKKGKMTIANPSIGIQKMNRDEFSSSFTGVLIVMVPKSEFEKTKLKNKGMIDLFCSLILPQKRLIATILICSIVLSVVGIILSSSSKILMDEIIPYQLKNTLYIFLIAFGLITILQSLLNSFRQHVILYLSRKVDIPIMMGYYDHILHLPYNFFVSRKIGDIITRFQDAMTIKNIFTSASVSLILDLALSIVSAIVLWNMNSTLFSILLIMVIINIVLVYIFKKPYKKINYDQMESSARMNSHLIESIRNIETLKSQNDENHQIDILESKFVNLLKIGYKEGVLQNTQSFISSVVSTLGNLIFMGVGALFIIDGKMSIGDLLVFQSLSAYFTGPVQSIVSLQITYQEAQIAMKRLNELMDLDREDSYESKLKDISLNGSIEFENVEFAYGSRPSVIKGLNLKIEQGKKVAIVGESGAGKSTIAKLLLKFMTPQSGKILISGYELSDIDQYYIRKKVAYIPQNIELFTGTIMDNLKIGNDTVTYEEIILACKKAGAHQFIDNLPNRYNAYIEEGGSNFSGGEKQRIAIARALLANPELYVFDEATSNLDSFSEKQIHKLIFNNIQNKTVLIIAHRLSTILNCDYIHYMSNGKIIESGTHDELMNLNGKYAEMILMQSLNGDASTEKDNNTQEDIHYE